MKKIIKFFVMFLVRKKLGLKKYQEFQFDNQKDKTNRYYFSDYEIVKIEPVRKIYKKYKDDEGVTIEYESCREEYQRPSTVSLNYLLSDEVKIVKVNKR